jgi:hypothetical protein
MGEQPERLSSSKAEHRMGEQPEGLSSSKAEQFKS